MGNQQSDGKQEVMAYLKKQRLQKQEQSIKQEKKIKEQIIQKIEISEDSHSHTNDPNKQNSNHSQFSHLNNMAWLNFILQYCENNIQNYAWCGTLLRKMDKQELSERLKNLQIQDLKSLHKSLFDLISMDSISQGTDYLSYNQNSNFISEIRREHISQQFNSKICTQNSPKNFRISNSNNSRNIVSQNSLKKGDSVLDNHFETVLGGESSNDVSNNISQFFYQQTYQQYKGNIKKGQSCFYQEFVPQQPTYQNLSTGFQQVVDQTILFHQDVQNAVFKKKVADYTQKKEAQKNSKKAQLARISYGRKQKNNNNKKKNTFSSGLTSKNTLNNNNDQSQRTTDIYSDTYSRSVFNENDGGVFDTNNNILKNQEKEKLEYQEGVLMISYFKRVTEMIESHIQNKSVFKSILKVFQQSINQKYIPILNSFYNDSPQFQNKENQINKMKSKLYEMVREINQFTAFFQNSITHYYCLKDLKKIGGVHANLSGLVTNDNMSNFCTTLVFNDSLYALVFEFFKLVDQTEVKFLKSKCQKLSQKEPQHFGVSDQLGLNEKTIDFLENQKKEEIVKLQKEKNVQNENNLNNFDIDNYVDFQAKSKEININNDVQQQYFRCKSFQNISHDTQDEEQLQNNKENQYQQQNQQQQQQRQTIDSIDVFFNKSNNINNCFNIPPQLTQNNNTINNNNINKNGENIQESEFFKSNGGNLMEDLEKIAKIENSPYDQVIINLQNIQFLKSPIHKLKTLVQCVALISLEVEQFYETYWNKEYVKDNIIMESDDLISIIVYIIVQAQIPDCISHFKFIESFLSPNLACSISGYHLTNFQAAIKYLQDFEISKDEQSEQQQEEKQQNIDKQGQNSTTNNKKEVIYL